VCKGVWVGVRVGQMYGWGRCTGVLEGNCGDRVCSVCMGVRVYVRVYVWMGCVCTGATCVRMFGQVYGCYGACECECEHAPKSIDKCALKSRFFSHSHDICVIAYNFSHFDDVITLHHITQQV
jgi:hypothetical protein